MAASFSPRTGSELFAAASSSQPSSSPRSPLSRMLLSQRVSLRGARLGSPSVNHRTSPRIPLHCINLNEMKLNLFSCCISTSVLLYVVLLMILLSPFDMFYLSSRFYFLRTVWRIIHPLQAITFPDFFLAEIFTSLSKFVAWLIIRSICGNCLIP